MEQLFALNRNNKHLELIRKHKLLKLKKKNLGNKKLLKAIDKLIQDIEKSNWKTKLEIQRGRTDADCVHNDGFYFFDINIHRTMILLEFEDEEANVIWVGSHDEYTLTFKNNKRTIEIWLRSRGLIK